MFTAEITLNVSKLFKMKKFPLLILIQHCYTYSSCTPEAAPLQLSSHLTTALMDFECQQTYQCCMIVLNKKSFV